MNLHVIICGHGKFASGLQGALHLLTKIPSNWSFIDFKEGMSDEQLKKQISDIVSINPNDQYLFFTDLLGGTPFKVTSSIAFKKENMAVVTGCNLASLLEIMYASYDSIETLADAVVNNSKKATVYFKLEDDLEENVDQKSDGI
ncbi:MAG: PTS sugar transporter subunit IIA [Liquorilactobacillus ghanensis]|uniref:PTS sugar transporter subunit IIA domain-containing protein n=1 Tax=Liquorilactobacillus ghanensis TaxID=399370 RepID=UPI0039ED19DB